MNTMLRLKKIKIKNEHAEADFYPENMEQAGHIVVDLLSEEIVSFTDVPGYGASYRGQAAQRLVQMAKENDQRDECTVMWY